MYKSKFNPSPNSIDLLTRGNIIGEDETAPEMIERVVYTLSQEESNHLNSQDLKQFEENLGQRMDDGRIIMSTPIMTNAGRYPDRPLSACTMPTADLLDYNIDFLKFEINKLHEQGMGTGFNLNPVDDPVKILKMLNQIALEGSRRDQENRPVGNMAILDVYHPKILEFINCKNSTDNNSEEWKFNISVNLDDDFFKILYSSGKIKLLDGRTISAEEIFSAIVDSTMKCADPGLIFLDRLNYRNPIPGLGKYKTIAPCAEVGLLEGESCQFGNINIAKFISLKGDDYSLNYSDLAESVKVLTRALDSALSISIKNYATVQSSEIMKQKRKIGIGISGVADAISIAGLIYNSDKARVLLAESLSFINYISKLESHEIAKTKGSALSMYNQNGNRYFDEENYIAKMYGMLEDTESISNSEWISLGNKIKNTGLLRNTTTVALPPTGRSALIYDSSTGVEPHFSIDRISESVKIKMAEYMGRLINDFIDKDKITDYIDSDNFKEYLSCALDISPLGHIAMVSTLQKYTDESISKTINLKANSTTSEIEHIYIKGYEAGLSGITIYVDGSRDQQPIVLKEK